MNLTRLQSAPSQINVSLNHTSERIREAGNYIRSHSNEHITLDHAAGIAGYSTTYFSRKFSQTFGISFPEFLLESRLLHAKQPPQQPTFPLNKLHWKRDFHSQATLSAVLKPRKT